MIGKSQNSLYKNQLFLMKFDSVLVRDAIADIAGWLLLKKEEYLSCISNFL
jgi:hypothetical protein